MSITIEYKVRKDYCNCCNQRLPKPKESEPRAFTFGSKNTMEYAPWKDIIEDKDDFKELTEEFVYDTIYFFAISLDDKLIIEKSEVDKVREFIKELVI